MLKRQFTAEHINAIANHSSVKHGAKIAEEADLLPLVNDYRHVVLAYEQGGFVLLNKGSQTYEVHTLALPEGRGPILRDAVKEMLHYLFLQTDCERLITTAYKASPLAMALSEEFMAFRGETDEYKYYELTYRDWVITSPIAKQAGEEFHNSVETDHGEDSTHDSHVGGAILLVKYGNVGKAKKVYNEWAVMSGYAQCSILNVSPLILGIGEMRLIYHNMTLGAF